MQVNSIQKSFVMYYKYTPETDLILDAHKNNKEKLTNVLSSSSEEKCVIG
jgi:hypothetical protein